MRLNPFFKSPVAMLIIVLAGFSAYANTFHVPFFLDDHITIIRDTTVHQLANFLPSAPGHALAHPRAFSYFTFALNYHFGGLNVGGFHLVNLSIHIAAALLVYTLLRLTWRTPVLVAASASEINPKPNPFHLSPAFTIPLLAALLFLLHPLQTQAVTYIVQRMTSLATLLYLLTLVLYVQGRLAIEAPDAQSGSRKAAAGWLAGSVLVAVLAMKTKEIAVTLPLAALLYEACFFRGIWRRRVIYLLPLLLTLPIVPLNVLLFGRNASQATGDLLAEVGQTTQMAGKLSNLDYLFTQFRVIVSYLRLLIFPVGQNLDHDYPTYTTFFTPPVWLSFLLLCAILTLAIYLFSKRNPQRLTQKPTGLKPLDCALYRLIAFGIFWFFLTLTVESSVISIADVMVEHRLYLPSFGAATAIAAAFWLLTQKFPKPVMSRTFPAAALTLVLLLGMATFARNAVWGDTIRMWQDVLSKSPGKVRAYNNLGFELNNAGRYPEAIELFQRAIAMDPQHPHAYGNLALTYIQTGRSSEAVSLLKRAIGMDLNYTDAYINLAAAYNQLRRFQETISLLESNLRRGELAERVETQYHLGVAYAFLGNRETARKKLDFVSRNGAADLATDLIRLLGTP